MTRLSYIVAGLAVMTLALTLPSQAQFSTNPKPWPSASAWRAYTYRGSSINDLKTIDPSNGGTRPQSAVNISSGEPDQSRPSVYYYPTSTTLFVRFRVESRPVAYAGGATAGNSDPWQPAYWVMHLDLNGDGWRDFSMYLNGSSGTSSKPIDDIQLIWSNLTTTQSIDYVANTGVKLLTTVPAAAVYTTGPDNGELVEYDGNGNPKPSGTAWPNGRNTTLYDFGTSRVIDSTATGGDWFIDFQIPFSALDARSVGGPLVTSTTPLALAFSTANTMQNPFQKDAAFAQAVCASEVAPMATGDIITFNPTSTTTTTSPLTLSLNLNGACPPTISVNLLSPPRFDNCSYPTSDIDSLMFEVFDDKNANGLADDATVTWRSVGKASSPVFGVYVLDWNSALDPRGAYIIRVAIYKSPSVLYSDAQNFGTTGPKTAYFINSCGLLPPVLSKTVNVDTVEAGGSAAQREIVYTLKVKNSSTATAIRLDTLIDVLPTGFTYLKDTTTSSIVPVVSPTAGSTGRLVWTFGAGFNVAAGATDSLKIKVRTSSSAGTYTNTLEAKGNVTYAPAQGTAPVVVKVTSASLTKSISTTSALLAGQTYTYTITYQNTGTVNLTGATVVDSLDAGIDSARTISNGGIYTSATRKVTWTLGTLTPGQTASLSFQFRLSSPYAGGQVLANTATLSASQLSTPVTSNTVTSLIGQPDLDIVKTAGAATATPGATISYTIQYGNSGFGSATGVVITDTLSSNLTYVAGSATPLTPSIDTVQGRQRLRWTIGTVASGSTNNRIEYAAAVRTPYLVAGEDLPLINRVTVTSNENSPRSGGDTVLITARPYVTVSKTVKASTVRGNGEVAFSILLQNSGQAPARVTSVRDTLPSGFTFLRDSSQASTLSASVKPAAGASILSWSSFANDTIPAGSTRTLTFIVQATSVNGTYTNFGYATGRLQGNTETTPPPGQVSVAVFTGTESIQKTVNKTSAFRGDTVVFTLTYRNNMGFTYLAGERKIRDSVDSRLQVLDQSFVQYDSLGAEVGTDADWFVNTSTSNVTGARLYTWLNDADFPSGQSAVFTIRARVRDTVTAGYVIRNRGYVLNGTNAVQHTSDRTETTVRSTPVLTLTKTASPDSVTSGGELTYTLAYSVTNGNVSNVQIIDSIGTSQTYVSGSATDNGVFSASPSPRGSLVWNLGFLSSGASGSVSFKVRTATGLPNLTPIINRAYILSTEVNGAPSADTSTIAGLPDLSVVKSSPVSSAAPGDTVEFKLVVRNNGNGATSTVSLVDTLPALLTYVSSSRGTPSVSGQVLSWSLASLSPSASDSVVFRARIASPLNRASQTSLRNTASVWDNARPNDKKPSNPLPVDITYPLLSVTKQVDSTRAAPGSTLTFTVEVVNNAATAARSVTLQDSIPSNTTYVASSTRVDGSPVADVSGTSPLVAGLDLGRVAGFSTRQVTFRVTVNSPLDNGLSITNRARAIDSQSNDTSRSNTTSTTVNSAPALTMTKTVSAATGSPGDTLTYAMVYTNTGTTSANKLLLVDPIPSATTYVLGSVSGNNASFDPVFNRIVVTRDTLAAGASDSVSFRVVVVNPGTPGTTSVGNTATISASNAPAVTASVSTSVTAVATLSLTKVGPVTALKVGTVPTATFSYGLAYSLSGNATQSSVVVRDTLPASVTFVSSTPAPSTNTLLGGGERLLTWNAGTLVPGSFGLISVSVTSTTNGTVENKARITSSTNGSGTPSDTVRTIIKGGITGTITQPDSVRAGRDVTITVDDADLRGAGSIAIEARNTRTNELETVLLYETGPSTGIFVGFIPTVDDSTLGLNQSGYFHVVPGDLVRGRYLDTLTTSGGRDSVFDQTSFFRYRLSVQKLRETSKLAGGDTLRYMVTVRNTGSVPLGGVVVTDTIRSPLIFLSSSAPFGVAQGVLADSIVTFTRLTPLPVGQTDSMHIIARINPSTPAGQKIRNTASVASDSLPTERPTEEFESYASGLSITKELFTSHFAPGDTVTYGLIVRNTSGAVLNAVVLLDTVRSPLVMLSKKVGGVTTALTQADSIINVAIGVMAAGRTDTVVVRARIPESINPGTVVRNRAFVTAAGTDTLENDENFTVYRRSFSLAKSLATTGFAAGDTVTFRIVTRNTGDVAIANIRVRDTLHTPLTVVSARSTTQGIVTPASPDSVVALTIGSLAPAAADTLTIRARLAASLAGGTTVGNRVFATADSVGSRDSSASFVSYRRSVSVRKEFVNGSAAAADTVVYRLIVRNTGTVSLSNVVLRDSVRHPLRVVSKTVGGSTTLLAASDSTQSFVVPTLAVGAADTILIRARILAATPGGTLIRNTVVASADSLAPVDSTNEFTTLARGLALQKDVLTTHFAPRDTVSFRIIVSNTGASPLNTVVVADTIRAPLVRLSQTTTGGVLTAADSVLQYTRATLSPGAADTIIVRVQIGASVPGNTLLRNIATGSADGIAPTTDDASFTSYTRQVAIEKRPITAAAGAGDTITYRIVVRNSGQVNLSNLVVSDTLRSPLRRISQSATRGVLRVTADSIITSTYATLLTGVSDTILIRARILPETPSGTIVENRAVAGADSLSPRDSTSRFTSYRRGLSVSKLAMTDKFASGDTVTFRVIVANTGTVALSNVVVRDTIRLPLRRVSQTAKGTVTVVDSIVTVTHPTLAVGAADTIVIRARLLTTTVAGTTVRNNAVATADSVGRRDSTVSFVSVRRGLTIAKLLVSQGFAAGDTVRYRLLLTNTGTIPITNVAVADTIRSPLTALSASSKLGTVAANDSVFSVTYPSVAAGARDTITVLARLSTNVPSGVEVRNTAHARGDDTPLYQSTVTFVTEGTGALTIQKRANRSLVIRGDTVVYTIRVANAGSAPLTGIVMKDTVRASLGTIVGIAGVGTFADSVVSYTRNLLLPGEADTIRVTVRVLAGSGGVTATRNTAVVSADGGQTSTSSADVVAEPPLVDVSCRAHIRAVPQTVLGNGIDASTIEVFLSDTLGNPKPDGVKIFLRSTVGTFSNGRDTISLFIRNGFARDSIRALIVAKEVVRGKVAIEVLEPQLCQVRDSVGVIFYPGAVAGTVINQATGKLVEGAIVQLIDASGRIVESITTGADGAYLFPVDRAGTYTVQILFKNEFGDQVTSSAPVNVTIPNVGGTPPVRKEISIAGTIYYVSEGGVFKAVNLPVYLGAAGTGGSSRVVAGKASAIIDTTLSDFAGNYRFEGVQPGTYRVSLDTLFTNAPPVNIQNARMGETIINANIPIPLVPSLALTKSGPAQAYRMDTVSYCIQFTNSSSFPLTNVVIRDTLDPIMVFVRADSGVAPSASRVLTWIIPSVPPGGSFSACVKVTFADTLRSQQLATTPVGVTTGQTSPRRAVVQTLVLIPPAMDILKVADRTTAAPGDTIRYTVTVSNPSPFRADSVVLTDQIPAPLQYVSSVPAGTYDATNRRVTWQQDSIAAGGTMSVTLAALVRPDLEPGAYNYTNVATATWKGGTASSAANPNSRATVRTNVAYLAVSKEALRPTAEIGDIVPYALNITNRSRVSSAVGLTIHDYLPLGVRYLAKSSFLGGTQTVEPQGSARLVWNLPDTLRPGQTLRLTYRTSVGAGGPQGDGINTAFASALTAFGDTMTSTVATAKITIRRGAFTDRGVLIGKVFFDPNRNAYQDPGEDGIPNVELIMEDGARIVTGADGKYSVSDIAPGMHVIKVRRHTLPKGSELHAGFTDFANDPASRFVEVTPSGIARADFYVHPTLRYFMSVMVMRDDDLDGVPDAGGALSRIDVRINGRDQFTTDAAGRALVEFGQAGAMTVEVDPRSLAAGDILHPTRGDTSSAPGFRTVKVGPDTTIVVFLVHQARMISWIRSLDSASVLPAPPVKPFVLSGANFDVGKDVLKPVAIDRLAPVVNYLRGKQNVIVVVEGHTDSSPINTRQFPNNYVLSNARAETVKRYLVQNAGMKADAVMTLGYGPDKPLATNKTVEGRSVNRRIEIAIYAPADVTEAADVQLLTSTRVSLRGPELSKPVVLVDSLGGALVDSAWSASPAVRVRKLAEGLEWTVPSFGPDGAVQLRSRLRVDGKSIGANPEVRLATALVDRTSVAPSSAVTLSIPPSLEEHQIPIYLSNGMLSLVGTDREMTDSNPVYQAGRLMTQEGITLITLQNAYEPPIDARAVTAWARQMAMASPDADAVKTWLLRSFNISPDRIVVIPAEVSAANPRSGVRVVMTHAQSGGAVLPTVKVPADTVRARVGD